MLNSIVLEYFGEEHVDCDKKADNRYITFVFMYKMFEIVIMFKSYFYQDTSAVSGAVRSKRVCLVDLSEESTKITTSGKLKE